jgi:RimJ/RimL family protein N-acetyltransferase
VGESGSRVVGRVELRVVGRVGLRVVGQQDWELWRQARLAALRDAPQAFCSTLADWERAAEQRWRDRLAEVPLNLLAIRNGAPVGMVSAGPAEAAGAAELISLWVAPAERGGGSAGRLVERVCTWAGDQGFDRVMLWVLTRNAGAARFYARAGFGQTGRVQEAPGRVGTEFEMARPLSGGRGLRRAPAASGSST